MGRGTQRKRAESENTKRNETVTARHTPSESRPKKFAPLRDAPAVVCSRGQKQSTTIACTSGIHTKKVQSREDGRVYSIERMYTAEVQRTCHATLSSQNVVTNRMMEQRRASQKKMRNVPHQQASHLSLLYTSSRKHQFVLLHRTNCWPSGTGNVFQPF